MSIEKTKEIRKNIISDPYSIFNYNEITDKEYNELEQEGYWNKKNILENILDKEINEYIKSLNIYKGEEEQYKLDYY